jgi:hypothetical protein
MPFTLVIPCRPHPAYRTPRPGRGAAELPHQGLRLTSWRTISVSGTETGQWL